MRRNLLNLPFRHRICPRRRIETVPDLKYTIYQCQWTSRRGYATETVEKPYYITTPIFYVNAAPHVGHMYTMVLTDILKRWQTLLGKKAILCTGTDEHGMKVQQAATKARMEPKPFCSLGAEKFRDLAKRVGMSNEHFVRTTDLDHQEAVRYFWLMLQDRGYIYLSKHKGWYCVSDETFYPPSAVHLILEPTTGRKIMASIETGKEVQWTEESNYHFRLSVFRGRLLDFYKQNPEFVVPAARMADVVQAVESGLEDLSISRPVERLSWGIRVPDDESQTIYVWLDALINYITKAGYPWTPGQEQNLGWPADCQVIGKDIVKFHCIYWPAFLLALDIPLPKRILTHAHWTLGKQKMAKSTGNVVNPFFALDRFGVDAMRYYLAHDGGIASDSDYENTHIVTKYKKGLQGGLGNLTSRITRGKGWSVRRAVEASGYVEGMTFGGESTIQYMRVDRTAEHVMAKMEELDVSGALKVIMDTVYETNRYLQLKSPWDIVSSEHPRDKLSLNNTIYLCAEAIRVCGILLQPYMPGKMQQLLDMLGVEPEHRGFEYARLGRDTAYGTSKVSLGRGTNNALFPPIVSEF